MVTSPSPVELDVDEIGTRLETDVEDRTLETGSCGGIGGGVRSGVGVGSTLEADEAAREEACPLRDCELADATDDGIIAVDGVSVMVFVGEMEVDDVTAGDGVAEYGVAEVGVAED